MCFIFAFPERGAGRITSNNKLNKQQMKKRIPLLLILGMLTSVSVFAQKLDVNQFSVNEFQSTIAPFLFSSTTLTAQDMPWSVAYSSNYGQRISGPFGYDGVEQQISIKGYLGKQFTLYAYAGLGFPQGNVVTTAQQVEVVRNFIGGKKSQGWRIGLGVGANRDYSNVLSVLGRVVASYDQPRWKLAGNLLFEKALAKDRDAIDIITSLGIQYRVVGGLYAGVEAVGEDLEGLWQTDEAEGGARIMVGPSLNLVPSRSRFSFSLSGGPVMYATKNNQSNPDAIRELPFQNGLTIRARVIFKLSKS